MLKGEMFLFVSSLMLWNQQRPSYTNFMLIRFVSMRILLSTSLMLMNIVVSYCPSHGFHKSLTFICTCCYTRHSTLLATTMNSIVVEVLMVLMFMWIWMMPWLNQWRLHVQKLPQHCVLDCFVDFLMWKSC
jgi:hypothetical protein